MSKTKILFVCLGNICRSPLAEAVFNHKIKEKRLEQFFEADSCGTSNYHIGQQPDERAVSNALKNGVVISHLGRQLCENDFEKFDYVIAMDKSNYDNILRLKKSKPHLRKVLLMRSFDPVATGDVPDPYFGGETGFQKVFEILDRSIENFIGHLQENHVAHDLKK